MINPHDGFPLSLSPLGWAKVCRLGGTYSYENRGMVPELDNELDALIDVCAERGLSLGADSNGLGVHDRIDE